LFVGGGQFCIAHRILEFHFQGVGEIQEFVVVEGILVVLCGYGGVLGVCCV
jgi:hypothetical protein